MAESAVWVNLGRMEYRACAEYQRDLLERVAADEAPHTLLLVEHPAVLTLGANFHNENLIYPREFYTAQGIAVEPTDRGGDVTYHGPAQLVAYPIFNLRRFGQDVHKWLRDLEETIICLASSYGLEGYRFPPNTGVWVNGRKLAAIGIKVRKWTSMHGIALNCNNDLKPFSLIVPCGIKEFGVTNLTQETGKDISIDDARPALLDAFAEVFDLQWVQK